MAISNIWTNEEYQNKVEKLLEDKNSFELDAFFEKHQFRIDDILENQVNDHDIFITDEITFEVFIEHLDCYFKF